MKGLTRFGIRHGFSLIITLALMMLLIIIAVGMLSLSTVALRHSSRTTATSQAQTNARMAMMLAIGELQNHMGPDQRVTAPATLLDANPATAAPEGLAHPRITGVWNARNAATDSLESYNNSPPDYSRDKPHFRRWLISHANATETEQLNFAINGSLPHSVRLLASQDPTQQVLAGRVPVKGGSYAWWVGDENCKGFINPHDEADRKADPSPAELLVGLATPGPYGILALDGFKDFPANTSTSEKLITRDTLPLVASAVDTNQFFHDLSPYPRSVLADVTHAGLRKDLSLYLERSDINWRQGWGRAEGASGMPKGPLGPNGKIALSNPDDHDVLAWKHLHHWSQLHRQQLANQQELPVSAMLNTTPDIDPISNPAWNCGVTRITPVVVRLQMLISLGLQRQTNPNEYRMRIYSYPVVTLWNPYNVPMKVTEWSTFIHSLPLVHTIFLGGVKHNLTGGGTLNGNYNWGFPEGNMTLRVGGATGPGLTFAPGEAKILSYRSSKANSFFDFNAHDMIESPPAWLPTHAGQARDLGMISGASSAQLAISTALATLENSGTSHKSQNTFDFRCEPRAIHPGNHSARFLKQMFSSQVGWRHEAGNPRIGFISENNFPSTTLADLNHNPMPFLHLDIRLKTLDEPALPNKTWLHNIPFHPYAASTSTSMHSSKGVDSSTSFFAHPYTLTFEQVSALEGIFQNRAFFGPSNRPGGQSRIVSSAVPLAPMTSLAQLQNLPLLPIEGLNWSGYYFQNHAIGNSFASPGLPPVSTRATSFPFYLGQYFPWQGGDIAGRTYNDITWFNNAHYTISGAPAQVADRSYAANHLLFDEYFFSSMAAQDGPIFGRYGTKRSLRAVVHDFFSGKNSLPVAAYRSYSADASTAADVTNLLVNNNGALPEAYLKSAANLMVDGGFNINSTSVPAWTAVLSAANRKRPVFMPGDSQLSAQERANYVVSRNPNPSTGNATEASRWLGYRELTADEIRQLAEAVVRQVKIRGPFRSLGEFVNRRLTAAVSEVEMAKYGALQAALEDPKVDINRDYRGGSKEITAADIASTNYKFPAAAMGSRYQGTPAYINQADLLTPIAPIMQARSDTFLIRAYGEARSPDGQTILARAWCEAVVQRVPEYIDPQDPAFTSAADLKSEQNRTFGRRFIIESFRWLTPSETEI